MFIGRVFTEQGEKTPSIVLSRRLNDSKGNFNGIVSVNLDKDNLVGVFQKLELSDDKGILLLRRDRTFLARYPLAIDAELQAGYFMEHPVFASIAEGKLFGEYETKSPADGQERISDIVQLIQGRGREKITDLPSGVLETGEGLHLRQDVVLIDTEHKEYCIEGSVSPIYGEADAITGAVFSFYDVTENREKQRKIEYLSYHDQLTGLYNRNYLEEILATEMARADRYRQALSMIILDLDHFKKVNDTYGHPIGDKVLKATAKITAANVRKVDIPARIGGEEFVVIMPETNTGSVVKVAEKIRVVIEQHKHPLVGKVSASLGIAQRLSGESFQDWYKRADAALYQAKQKGRNRVVNAPDYEKQPMAVVLMEWQSDWGKRTCRY